MPEPDYFTLAELRALPGMAAADETRALEVAAYITEAIESGVGTSFVARERTDVLDGLGRDGLALLDAYPRVLTTVTVDGVSVDTGLLQIAEGAVLRYTDEGEEFPVGRQNVTVVYTVGYSDEPPADVREAALLGTREHLLATGSNGELAERQQAMVRAAKTADPSSTGYVDVDAVIRRYRDRVELLGFA